MHKLIPKIRKVMLQVVIIFALTAVVETIAYPIGLLLLLIPDELAPLSTALGMLLVAITIGVDVFLIVKFRKQLIDAIKDAMNAKYSQKGQS